jgi:hypothetical protein
LSKKALKKGSHALRHQLNPSNFLSFSFCVINSALLGHFVMASLNTSYLIEREDVAVRESIHDQPYQTRKVII